jgi:hypothetical protein
LRPKVIEAQAQFGLEAYGIPPYIALHEPGLSAGNGGFKRNFKSFGLENGSEEGGPFALL